MDRPIPERLNILLIRLRLWSRPTVNIPGYTALEDQFWGCLIRERWIEKALASLLRENPNEIDQADRELIVADALDHLFLKFRSGHFSLASRKYVKGCVRNILTRRHREMNREAAGGDGPGDAPEEGRENYLDQLKDESSPGSPEADADQRNRESERQAVRRRLDEWKRDLGKRERWTVAFFIQIGMYRKVSEVRKRVNEALALDHEGHNPMTRIEVEAVGREMMQRLNLTKEVIEEAFVTERQRPKRPLADRAQPPSEYRQSDQIRDMRADLAQAPKLLHLMSAYETGSTEDQITPRSAWPKTVVESSTLELNACGHRLARLHFSCEMSRRFYGRIVSRAMNADRLLEAFDARRPFWPNDRRDRAVDLLQLARDMRIPFEKVAVRPGWSEAEVYETLQNLSEAWNEERRQKAPRVR